MFASIKNVAFSLISPSFYKHQFTNFIAAVHSDFRRNSLRPLIVFISVSTLSGYLTKYFVLYSKKLIILFSSFIIS